MTTAELNWFHTKLVETKESENSARKKALEESNAKSPKSYSTYQSKRSRRR